LVQIAEGPSLGIIAASILATQTIIREATKTHMQWLAENK
jgi:hypothetical protein